MIEDRQRGGSALRAVALLAGTGIGVLQIKGGYAAETTGDTPDSRGRLDQVTVFGQRDAYTLDASGLLKLAAPLIDVPQSINTVSALEMQDRAVMQFEPLANFQCKSGAHP